MTIEDIALQMTPGIGPKGAVHLLEQFGDARSVFAATAGELTGKAEDINNEVNKYRSVTAGQIKEAAQKTFVRENCSTLYYKSNLPT